MTSPKQHSYEEELRGLGAYLDRRGGRDVQLMEIPSGFVVRFQPKAGGDRHALVQFDHSDLSQRNDVSIDDRDSDARERYEAFLRAIGRALDETGARHILVEQLNEKTMVRYTYVHDERHSLVEDRCAMLGPNERKQLLMETVS